MLEKSLIEHKRSSDSPNKPNDEDFYNSINHQKLELPYVGSFRLKGSKNTLDYEIFQDSSCSRDFTSFLYFQGDKARMSFNEPTSIKVYTDGGGGNDTEEIGVMLGSHTSACKNYSVTTYSSKK